MTFAVEAAFVALENRVIPSPQAKSLQNYPRRSKPVEEGVRSYKSSRPSRKSAPLEPIVSSLIAGTPRMMAVIAGTDTRSIT